MPSFSELIAKKAASQSETPSLNQSNQNSLSEKPSTGEVARVPAAPKIGLLRLGGIKSSVPETTNASDSAEKASQGGSALQLLNKVSPSGSSLGMLATIAGMQTTEKTQVPMLMGDLPSDHVAPTAPERELPENLTDVQEGFVKSLDTLYKVFDDGELFVGAVGRIMAELASHPFLEELIHSADDNTIIRGIRISAGMARVQKTAAKEKRATTKKSNVSADMADAIAQLSGLVGGGSWDD